jgi:vacuolar-type H+-ATPase subunit H
MPIPSLGPGQNGGSPFAEPSAPGLDDQAFETIGQTVRHAAGAIDGLKDTLERLQRSVAEATEQRRNDIEIGQLFTRAQDFAEGAVTEGHELAQRIVADAEFEASRIITAAKEEAHRLVEEGRHSASLPSEAVMALQATIAEFSRMNTTLVQELSTLTEALAVHDKGRAPASPTQSAVLPQSQPRPEAAPNGEPGAGAGVLPTPDRSSGSGDPEDGTTSTKARPPLATSGYWASLRPSKSARNEGDSGSRWGMR